MTGLVIRGRRWGLTSFGILNVPDPIYARASLLTDDYLAPASLYAFGAPQN